MKDKEFELRVKELLSDYSPKAMINWIKSSNEVESITSSEFCDLIIEELVFVYELYNVDIAKKIFDYGEIFTLDPFEIKGAADHLVKGGDINKICDLALEGLLD